MLKRLQKRLRLAALRAARSLRMMRLNRALKNEDADMVFEHLVRLDMYDAKIRGMKP